MTIIKLPGLYRYYVNGANNLDYPGNSVREVLEAVFLDYPALRKQLFDSKGEKKRHINIFVNKASIKDLNLLDTFVKPGDEITIIPNISGG